MNLFYEFFISLGLSKILANTLAFFIYEIIFLSFILIIGLTFFTYIRLRFINDKLEKSLEGRPKFLVYLAMALLGIVSPFCSCSTIPAFISLSTLSIPTGALFVYLIVSPLVQETSMILLLTEFGIPTTVLYIVFGVITGSIIGLLFSKLPDNELFTGSLMKQRLSKTSCCGKIEEEEKCGCENTSTNSEIKTCGCGCNSSAKIETCGCNKNLFVEAFEEGKEIYKAVYKYILIGVVFGSLIHGVIPQEFIENLLGRDNYIAPIFATLVGIPIYADDVALIPVAKSLLSSGAGLGTSLSFVMASAVVSVPSFILLSSIVKRKIIIRLIIILTISIMTIGFIFNFFQPYLIN